MSTAPPPVLGTPDWPYCAHGAAPATDPVGCRGAHVPGHTACLAHLTDTDRDTYLAGLTPGANIDHRGTPFTDALLDALLDALRDPATGCARLGIARFEWATFQEDAWFDDRVTFEGAALFESATFQEDAWFGQATFQGNAWFESATFQGLASFAMATFQMSGVFKAATFQGDAEFGSATFQRDVLFDSVTFHRDASFEETTFAHPAVLGPLVCAGRVQLSGAAFGGPADLLLAARWLECRRTRWTSTAELPSAAQRNSLT